MASRRGLAVLGLGALGAGSYYLYNAGGDVKTAEKNIEHDASKLSSKVKGEASDKGQDLKKQSETTGKELGAKFDQTVDQAREQGKNLENQAKGLGKDAEQKYEQGKKDTASGLTKAVDKFDESVTDAASKTKSGISSWFGGGK